MPFLKFLSGQTEYTHTSIFTFTRSQLRELINAWMLIVLTLNEFIANENGARTNLQILLLNMQQK